MNNHRTNGLCLTGKLQLIEQEGGYAFPAIQVGDMVLEAEVEEMVLEHIDKRDLSDVPTEWVVTIVKVPKL